jgi:predicted transcriptional regulator
MSESAEKTPIEHGELLAQTTDIVASYVANNAVAVNDLHSLIAGVFASLQAQGKNLESEAPPQPQPAVPIRKSVHRDYIVCLEDGKKLKTLKRHLRIRYNLTPAEYRRKWGLPPDYPMVAPSYAERRSELALKIGLGRSMPKSGESVAEAPPEKVATPPAKSKSPRKKAQAPSALAVPPTKRRVAARRSSKKSS